MSLWFECVDCKLLYVIADEGVRARAEACKICGGLNVQIVSDEMGVAGYIVYRGTSGTALSARGTALMTSYSDTVLTAGTTYYYAVAAYDPCLATSA